MEPRRPDDGIIKLIPGRFSVAALQCGGAAGGGVGVGWGLSGATVASPNQSRLSRGIDRAGRVGQGHGGEQRQQRRPR